MSASCKKRNFILVIAAFIFIFGLTQVSFAQTCPTGDGAEPFIAGPVDSVNGFSQWVQDSGSVLPGGPLALELCLDPAFCFFDPVVAGNDFSALVGFGAEAFWWLAGTGMTGINGFDALLDMAVEAAWVAEVPRVGEQFPFTRLRIRIDIPVGGDGEYTVVHPYGQIVYNIVGAAANRDINDSFDIPFTPNAVNQGRVLPYLIWDPAIAPAAPAGYIGDGATPHEVIGSPCGNNFFQVIPPANVDIGAGLGQPMTQPLFTVQGKIRPELGFIVNRATYEYNAAGTIARANLWIRSAVGQNLEVSGGSVQLINPSGTRIMIEDVSDPGSYFLRQRLVTPLPTPPYNLLVNGELVPLRDTVKIIRANFNVNDDTLDVFAQSSDQANAPGFTYTDENGTPVATGPADPVPPNVPPREITATSDFGGSDTLEVDVRGGNIFQ